MIKKIILPLICFTVFASPAIAKDRHWGVGFLSMKNEMTMSDKFVSFTGATFSEQSGSANLGTPVFTSGVDINRNIYLGGVLGFGFTDEDTVTTVASASNNNLNMTISTEVGILAGGEARYNLPMGSSFSFIGSLGYYFVRINSYVEYSGPTGNGYVEAADDDNGLGYGVGMSIKTGSSGNVLFMYTDYPDVDLGFNSEYSLSGFSLLYQASY